MKLTIMLAASLALFINACADKTPTVTPDTPQPPKISTDTVKEYTQTHIVAKMLTTPSGNPKTLNTVLEKLMGDWHQSEENFSGETKTWMDKNNITGFYDTFSWGTDKGWVNFGDYRTVNGKPKKTGNGIISWHSGYEHLRFRETGSRGGFVDGMIEIKNDHTFIRHYQFFAPDGKMSYRSDTWSFTPGALSCFMWQTTYYKDSVATPYPAQKFCKK